MDAGLYRYEPRNQCPYCLWSKHVMFGCDDRPPCDGMMRPVARACRLLVQECEGCGFTWVSYDEDWWAMLPPERQSQLIDLVFAETEQRNGCPVVLFTIRPEYRVARPPIPDGQLGARDRAARRPLPWDHGVAAREAVRLAGDPPGAQ